ncbi:TrbI F-type domain-containing protein [Sphingopyxis granuli]|uniref:TrbI F-type domain-containing protein n=1 Tax=Sphingopyxis granuli TaxID=267128 RepID=UPI001BAF2795|nr:TrbI F-type domain-containing protein [Sphingopyxis granuli]QUM74701.1 TrbI F-type domain-containing protein [Sphingopyxis granuli]
MTEQLALTIGGEPLLPSTDAAAAPASRRRGFAGFSWGQILGGTALVAVLVWGGWATRELMILKERRIVSISLAGMANDFIMAEARSGASPEQVDSDTRHFMTAMQRTLQDRAAAGETIVVSEAVVAASMPDITPDVRAAVGEFIKRNPPPRVAAAAAAPAMPALMPSAPAAAAAANSPVFGGGGLLPGGGQ